MFKYGFLLTRLLKASLQRVSMFPEYDNQQRLQRWEIDSPFSQNKNPLPGLGGCRDAARRKDGRGG